jgi:hypothetical protein
MRLAGRVVAREDVAQAHGAGDEVIPLAAFIALLCLAGILALWSLR